MWKIVKYVIVMWQDKLKINTNPYDNFPFQKVDLSVRVFKIYDGPTQTDHKLSISSFSLAIAPTSTAETIHIFLSPKRITKCHHLSTNLFFQYINATHPRNCIVFYFSCKLLILFLQQLIQFTITHMSVKFISVFINVHYQIFCTFLYDFC